MPQWGEWASAMGRIGLHFGHYGKNWPLVWGELASTMGRGLHYGKMDLHYDGPPPRGLHYGKKEPPAWANLCSRFGPSTTFLQTTSNPNEATRHLNLRLPAMDLLVVALVILCCALGVLASCLAWLVASTTRRSSTPTTTICYHRTTQTEMSYTITKHYREPRLKALGHDSHGGWIDGLK